MKVTKKVCLLALLVVFTACTDGPFSWWMDLTPPRGGWLWVAKNSNASAIYKVDLSTGKHIDTLPAPFPKDWLGRNMGLAFGDDKLWVGLDEVGDEFDPGEEYLCWIDPVTGETGDWLELEDGISPRGFTWDGSHLWASGGGWVHRIDPNTGEVEYRFGVPFNVSGLAWDGYYLWAVTYPKSDDPGMRKIDPETGNVVHTIPNPCEGATGLTWDGEALWVNDAKSDRLYRISPKDGAILGYHEMSPPGRLPPPAPYGLAFEFPSE